VIYCNSTTGETAIDAPGWSEITPESPPSPPPFSPDPNLTTVER
jgi:hypothetical protein